METDVVKIKKHARRKEEENWAFRSFLKGYDNGNLDAMVYELVRKCEAVIDCTTCGNCCREIQPVLTTKDIKALSEKLKISPRQIREIYVQKDNDGDELFAKLPCPFLSDNRCSHYDSRPESCRSYPHIHKKYFTTRLIGVVQNYSICPIVFNVYEELKRRLKNEFIDCQENFIDFGY